MNKKNGVLAVLISALLIYLFLFQRENEDGRNFISSGNESSEQLEPLQGDHEIETDLLTANDRNQESVLKNKLQNNNVNKDLNVQDKFSYEDNWCIASEDLSEDDIYRAEEERKDWSLKRGMHFIHKDTADYEAFKLNNEYVEPYQELDVETLIEFGNKDDRMALITLMQREDVKPSERSSAAKKLVILGDTDMGLQQLVIEHLVSAAFRFSEQKQADLQVKRDLIDALALVELGLKRRNPAALNTYLMFADSEELLHGLVPDNVLSSNDLLEISKRTRQHIEAIDTERNNKNLPSIDEEDIPRIAQTMFNEDLAIIYDEYEGLLDESRVIQQWNDSYLQKTPCLEKLIARF
ncbi:hypothetical protein RS130_08395 [Paraglaciecola aquimarina]|uniref:Uncharacterized protein n=1 Tax=Paraglaciecola aquimarina TaxID=1235557 RepID=A0ABU3SVC5_9ALTE|nr:hypothetical protein [Paraglaciecola aquimarina]MDU0353945.1 hypothetical protein [Paraglaciecola aquimarina]